MLMRPPLDLNHPPLLPHRQFLRAKQAKLAAGKGAGMLGLLPVLMPLALIPALLLVWFHLADLHYLEIASLSFAGAASLGTVLLFGLFMLAYLTLCVIPSSLSVALAVALYGPGKVPRAVVGAWTASSGLLAVVWIISALKPNFASAFLLWPAHIWLAVLLGAWALCAAYPRASPSAPLAKARFATLRKHPLALGIANGVLGLLAYLWLIIPIDFLTEGNLTGSQPNLVQVARPVLLGFPISLAPGVFYMWKNRIGSSGTNKRQLMVLIMIVPAIMLTLSFKASREVRQLTLIAAGIVGSPAGPRLHRLPDSWNEQDKALVIAAFKDNSCAVDRNLHSAAGAATTRWLCGYQNFSFGRARLICNHPYMDARHKFTDKNLTCVLYIDNTLASLVTLPPPGPAKPAEQATTTAPAHGSP